VTDSHLDLPRDGDETDGSLSSPVVDFTPAAAGQIREDV
jgi:hypothetical protein